MFQSDNSAILAVLNSQLELSGPVEIPVQLLVPNIYTFSLTLVNVEGRHGTGQVRITYDPSVTLPLLLNTHASYGTIRPFDSLDIRVSMTPPSCIDTPQYALHWSVFSSEIGSDYIDSPVNLQSNSGNSLVFSAPSYSLQAGYDYRIALTVSVSVLIKDVITVRNISSTTVLSVRDGPVRAVVIGGSKRAVSQQQSFFLDASLSVDSNTPLTSSQNLLFAWQCVSSNISEVSSTSQGCGHLLSSLNSSVTRIAPGSLSRNTQYVFTVIVTAKGDVSRSDSASVEVQAVFDSLAVTVSPMSLQTPPSSVYEASHSLQVKLNGVIGWADEDDRDVTAFWSVTSANISHSISLSDKAQTTVSKTFTRSDVSSANQLQFPLSLTAFSLVPGASYNFRLTASADGFEAAVYSEIIVSVRLPPSGGRARADPPAGTALRTIFLLSSFQWNADELDYPLKFQFYFSFTSPLSSSSAGEGINGQTEDTYPISALSTSSQYRAILPSITGINDTIYLTVLVAGRTGAQSTAYTHVSVTPSSSAAQLTGTVIDTMRISLASVSTNTAITHSPDHLIQLVSVYAITLNSVDCTLAPDCLSLHRLSCSAVPHTCGACWKGYAGISGAFNGMCTKVSESMSEVHREVKEETEERHVKYRELLSDASAAFRNGMESKAKKLDLVGERSDVDIVQRLTSCERNEDCVSGACQNSLCTSSQQKQCPSTSSTGECSHHGICVTRDRVTSQGVSVCTTDNTACEAYCECDDDYGGRSCQYTLSQLVDISSARRDLCNSLRHAVQYTDHTIGDTYTLLSALAMTIHAHELVTDGDLITCNRAIRDVLSMSPFSSSLSHSSHDVTNTVISISLYSNLIAHCISVLLNLRRVRESLYTNEVVSTVKSLSDELLHTVGSSMISGEDAIAVRGEEMTLTVYNELRSAVREKRLSISSLSLSSSTSTDPSLQYIQLPAPGLDVCPHTHGYLQFALSEWVVSPFLHESFHALNTRLRFTALSSPLSTIPTSQAMSSSSPQYTVYLTFSQPQDWSTYSPNCSLITSAVTTPCDCMVRASTPTSVTFECNDVSRLCLTSSTSTSASSFSPLQSSYHYSGKREEETEKIYELTRLLSLSHATVGIEKEVEYSVSSFKTPVIPPVVPSVTSNPISRSLDQTSGTVVVVILLVIMITLLARAISWDRYTIMQFFINASDFGTGSAHKFRIEDAFSSIGVSSGSMVSFGAGAGGNMTMKETSGGRDGLHPGEYTNPHAEEPEHHEDMDERRGPDSLLCGREFDPVNLLSLSSLCELYSQSLLRHHSILRLFTFRSVRLTLTMKTLCVCIELLFILFLTSVIYNDAYTRFETLCEGYTTSYGCTSVKSAWVGTSHLCDWIEESTQCLLAEPPVNDPTYYVRVVVIVILASLLPLSLSRVVSEYVFTKDIRYSLRYTFFHEESDLATSHALSSHTLSYLDTSRLYRIINHITRLLECDEHLRNKVLLQHFILEQFHPIQRVILANHFFPLDSAKPDEVSIMTWSATVLVYCGLLLFFLYYIFSFTISSSTTVVFAWGVSLIFSWMLYYLVAEPVVIFLVYVLALLPLQGRLSRLKDILTTQQREVVVNVESTVRHSLQDYPTTTDKDAYAGMDTVHLVPIVSPAILAASHLESATAPYARVSSAIILGLDRETVNRITALRTGRQYVGALGKRESIHLERQIEISTRESISF